jgi:hypothetical protein
MGAWYLMYNEHICTIEHFFLYFFFTSGQAGWPLIFISGTTVPYPTCTRGIFLLTLVKIFYFKFVYKECCTFLYIGYSIKKNVLHLLLFSSVHPPPQPKNWKTIANVVMLEGRVGISLLPPTSVIGNLLNDPPIAVPLPPPPAWPDGTVQWSRPNLLFQALHWSNFYTTSFRDCNSFADPDPVRSGPFCVRSNCRVLTTSSELKSRPDKL